ARIKIPKLEFPRVPSGLHHRKKSGINFIENREYRTDRADRENEKEDDVRPNDGGDAAHERPGDRHYADNANSPDQKRDSGCGFQMAERPVEDKGENESCQV